MSSTVNQSLPPTTMATASAAAMIGLITMAAGSSASNPAVRAALAGRLLASTEALRPTNSLYRDMLSAVEGAAPQATKGAFTSTFAGPVASAEREVEYDNYNLGSFSDDNGVGEATGAAAAAETARDTAAKLSFFAAHTTQTLTAEGHALTMLTWHGLCFRPGCTRPHAVLNYQTNQDGTLLCAECDADLFLTVRPASPRLYWRAYNVTGLVARLGDNQFVKPGALTGAPLTDDDLFCTPVAMTAATHIRCPKCGSPHVAAAEWDRDSSPLRVASEHGARNVGRVLRYRCRAKPMSGAGPCQAEWAANHGPLIGLSSTYVAVSTTRAHHLVERCTLASAEVAASRGGGLPGENAEPRCCKE